GASQIMKEFLPQFSKILHYMLAPEHPSTMGEPCGCGRPDALRVCYCNDCHHFIPCCKACFIDKHRSTPFHWVELWNGSFLERKDISEIGYVIPLAHGPDCKTCYVSRAFDFVVTDITGVHKTKVSYCDCIGQTSAHFDLLLESQIFPATIISPQIGFTFNVLRDFHLHTLASKETPYDYLKALRRRTNNAFLEDVQTHYTHLLRVQRIWRVLTLLKRSGQVHNIDVHFPFRRKGNVMVPCFSCPEYGFNVPDEHWTDLDDDNLRFLITMMLMADGHFGLQRLGKVDDPDDISLLEGCGVFPSDAEYNEYVRNIVAYSEEKTTCSKFNAIELQNKLKFRGSVITGVLGVECLRHMFFISMVDLQKGERYANADFALAHAL
ncbi:hypothetical protein CPC08DRAFT_595712, partial [Agrocybe pediades]